MKLRPVARLDAALQRQVRAVPPHQLDHHPLLFVAPDAQPIVTRVAIEADQPRELPRVLGPVLHAGRGVEVAALNPPGDQGLAVVRLDRNGQARQPQPSRPRRQRRLVLVRQAERVPLRSQRLFREIVAVRRLVNGRRRQFRRGDLQARMRTVEIEPPVVAPLSPLDGRLATQDAALVPVRAAAKEHAVPLAIRRLDQVPMAGLLQRGVGPVGGHDGVRRVNLVRPGDRLRASHGEGVVVPRAALGAKEVIIVAAFQKVRSFGGPEIGAPEDVGDRADQFPLTPVVLLQQQAVEELLPRTVAQVHVDHPGATVVVVKERGVEAGAVQVDRLGPRSAGVGGRDDVVGRLDRRNGARPVDVRVDQVEQPVGLAVTQGRRPDAAGVGNPLHVQLRAPRQGVADQLPVDQVPGVGDRHAGPPLERGVGDVEVVALAADAGVRMKPRQNRIANDPLSFGHASPLFSISGVL